MITNAKAWAEARSLIRTNEVHGADEFKIPLVDTYEFTNTKRKEASGEGSLEVEDPDGTLLDFSNLSAENAVLYLSLFLTT